MEEREDKKIEGQEEDEISTKVEKKKRHEKEG